MGTPGSNSGPAVYVHVVYWKTLANVVDDAPTLQQHWSMLRVCCVQQFICYDVHSQKALSAYFTSEQIGYCFFCRFAQQCIH